MASTTVINKWCSEMQYAVEINDKETMECLLKSASDMAEYKNPLLLALLVDYAPIIHTVIRSIIQVSGVTNEKLARILSEARCPMVHVVSICDLEVVERMIEMGADLDYRENQMGLAALHMAAHAGDLQLAELLLRHGAEVDIRCHRSETPLHKAVNAGNFYMAKRLLARAANVNARDNSDLTPLHCAFHSHVQRDHIIWLLIMSGANLMARDAFGVTPFHLAFDFPEIIEYILASGTDPNVKELYKGRTPLHCIMERINYDKINRQIDSIRALLCYGADANDRDNDGSTPLHRIYETLKFTGVDNVFVTKEILRLCLDFGADVNARNSKGETILRVASDGHRVWAETLLEHIAKLQSQGLPVEPSDLQTIEDDPYYRDYYSICAIEILALKREKFYGNISFYNLLTANRKRMIDYSRNHDLMESFVNNCCYKKFPVYWADLSYRVNAAVERQKLMHNTAKFLSSSLGFISPEDVIMDKILSYLSELDMRKIIAE